MHGGVRGGEQRAGTSSGNCAHRTDADAGAQGIERDGRQSAPGSIHSDPVHALRARDAVRACLSAAGGGSGCGDGHRDADAAALPGLPILHDGMSVSRAVFQLVGSVMACRNGEDLESGSSFEDARRGREVQSLSRAIPCSKGEGGCSRAARDRCCRLHSGVCGGLSDGSNPVWQPGGSKRSSRTRSALGEHVPAAGSHRNRT